MQSTKAPVKEVSKHSVTPISPELDDLDVDEDELDDDDDDELEEDDDEDPDPAANVDSAVSVAEAGRRGGLINSQRKRALDPNYFRTIGKRGGQATAKNHDTEHYRLIGTRGGKSNAQAHDHDHFVELGTLGGAKVRAALQRGE